MKIFWSTLEILALILIIYSWGGDSLTTIIFWLIVLYAKLSQIEIKNKE